MIYKALYIFLLPGAILVFGSSDQYYWRDYTGVIPPDALPAGQDVNGHQTYIAEGYIHSHGLYVATLFPGQKEVEFPCYGVKKAAFDVKILCTDQPENFRWVKTTKETFKQDIANLDAVRAGYDIPSNAKVMYVGRISFQGHVLVGNVWHQILWFPFRGVQRPINSYEVLIVDASGIVPRIHH